MTAGRIDRTSVSAFVRMSWRAAPGLEDWRTRRAEESARGGVVDQARRPEADRVLAPPVREHGVGKLCDVTDFQRPREVVVSDQAQQWPVQHQAVRAFGVAGGEEDRHRAALGLAEEGGSLAACRVHDGAHVFHAGLERRDARWTVRHADAAPVEVDDAAERRKPSEDVGNVGVLPQQLDVRERTPHEDEVARSVAEHLVRKAGAVGGFRVSGRRNGFHRASAQVLSMVVESVLAKPLPLRYP